MNLGSVVLPGPDGPMIDTTSLAHSSSARLRALPAPGLAHPQACKANSPGSAWPRLTCGHLVEHGEEDGLGFAPGHVK